MRAPKGKRASTIGAENDPVNDPPLSELESLAAEFAAVRTFSIHCQAAILFALVQRGAIDAESVLAISRTLAAGFRESAAGAKSGRIPTRSAATIADMLTEFEGVLRSMTTQ
jgi:hypothetical protein